MEHFRNSPKDKWVTDPIFLGFLCLDFESWSILKGWCLQRKEDFLLWCTLSFGDGFVFGPSFQPLTCPCAINHPGKSGRSLMLYWSSLVPQSLTSGLWVLSKLPSSWCVCLMFELCVSWLRQRILEFQLWSSGEQKGCSCLQCPDWLVLCLGQGNLSFPSKYLLSKQRGRVHIQFVGITSIKISSVVCFRSLINMSFAICAGK